MAEWKVHWSPTPRQLLILPEHGIHITVILLLQFSFSSRLRIFCIFQGKPYSIVLCHFTVLIKEGQIELGLVIEA